ncbi:MAG: chemotaxis response regulator protein-glutamate methylesterase [Fimbriimonadaceae bacterium]
MSTRILIVDDSTLTRRMLADMLSGEPGFEVVGFAADGEEAVSAARDLRPDVITLDVEMPRRDGLSALKEIMRGRPTPVIMVSSLTMQGAEATLSALEAGALDFVTKPADGSFAALKQVKDELILKIKNARTARLTARPAAPQPMAKVSATSDKIVLVASSTGGPRALQILWQSLPVGFPAPVLLVQHMPAGFTDNLAKRMDRIGTVPIREAKPGDRIKPGEALLAPGGMHMRIGKAGSLEFDHEPPLHGVRPAADCLFESAARHYGNRCVAAVLTGMGRDGAQGALEIRQAGGYVLGESESTATIYGMPRAAKENGAVHAELPIQDIGAAITAAVTAGRVARAS